MTFVDIERSINVIATPNLKAGDQLIAKKIGKTYAKTDIARDVTVKKVISRK